MRHGSVPITLATLVINGVGEELFFRDVARRQLADALSPPRHPGPTSPLHRRHRRNGHSPAARCLRPYRRHRRTRSPPRRQPHLCHHAAPSVEYRDGVFVAGGYRVGVSSLPSFRRR